MSLYKMEYDKEKDAYFIFRGKDIVSAHRRKKDAQKQFKALKEYYGIWPT